MMNKTVIEMTSHTFFDRFITLVEGHRRNVAIRFGMNLRIFSLIVICERMNSISSVRIVVFEIIMERH